MNDPFLDFFKASLNISSNQTEHLLFLRTS